MSKNNNNLVQKGFTLIEVMIVLAIVGILLLAIFLVVPAAQRGARNNGRRNDVAKLLAIVNDHIINNNGYNLSDTTKFCNTVSPVVACGTIAKDNIDLSSEKWSQYEWIAAEYNRAFTATTTSLDIQNSGTAAFTVTNTVPLGNIVVTPGTKCDGASPTATGASPKQVTAQFVVETAGGRASACTES